MEATRLTVTASAVHQLRTGRHRSHLWMRRDVLLLRSQSAEKGDAGELVLGI